MGHRLAGLAAGQEVVKLSLLIGSKLRFAKGENIRACFACHMLQQDLRIATGALTARQPANRLL
ncbi:hypothetical protein D3C76_1588080 [compost metagenome]